MTISFTEARLSDIIDYFKEGYYSTEEGKEVTVQRYSVDVTKGTVLFVLETKTKEK